MYNNGGFYTLEEYVNTNAPVLADLTLDLLEEGVDFRDGVGEETTIDDKVGAIPKWHPFSPTEGLPNRNDWAAIEEWQYFSSRNKEFLAT